MNRFSLKQKVTASTLAIIAGALYCSWPFEYLANPTVATHHGLASELGAKGQPYWWLFDGLDIMASLLILIVAEMLWRATLKQNRWFKLAILSYGLFAALTIVDAALPMRCLKSLNQCGDVWRDPQLVAHGVASIGASIFLLLSAIAIWGYGRPKHIKQLDGIMYGVLGGWTLFGLASIIFYFFPGPGYLAQHYYITLSSIWIALLPFAAILTGNIKKASNL